VAVDRAANAMLDFIDVQHWVRGKGIKLLYFASFDEP
jgi:hypothetical protein